MSHPTNNYVALNMVLPPLMKNLVKNLMKPLSSKTQIKDLLSHL